MFPAFKVVIEKFYFKRLNKSSTCQRLLYKCKISSPQYSIPKDVITTIHPAQNSASSVILFCFLEAVLFTLSCFFFWQFFSNNTDKCCLYPVFTISKYINHFFMVFLCFLITVLKKFYCYLHHTDRNFGV